MERYRIYVYIGANTGGPVTVYSDKMFSRKDQLIQNCIDLSFAKMNKNREGIHGHDIDVMVVSDDYAVTHI